MSKIDLKHLGVSPFVARQRDCRVEFLPSYGSRVYRRNLSQGDPVGRVEVYGIPRIFTDGRETQVVRSVHFMQAFDGWQGEVADGRWKGFQQMQLSPSPQQDYYFSRLRGVYFQDSLSLNPIAYALMQVLSKLIQFEDPVFSHLAGLLREELTPEEVRILAVRRGGMNTEVGLPIEIILSCQRGPSLVNHYWASHVAVMRQLRIDTTDYEGVWQIARFFYEGAQRDSINKTDNWAGYLQLAVEKAGGPEAFAEKKLATYGPLVAELASFLEQGEGLEVGAGSFVIPTYFLKHGKRIVGLDYEKAMVDFGRKTMGLPEDLAQEGNMFDLEIANRKFKVAYSVGLLEHFNPFQVVAALRQQARVAENVIVVIPSTGENQLVPEARFMYSMEDLISFAREAGLEFTKEIKFEAPRIGAVFKVLPRLLDNPRKVV